MKPYKEGFTLIELLVVIAIIAIVAGVLTGCGGGGGSKGGIIPNPVVKPIGNQLFGVCFGPYLKGNPDTGSVVSEGDIRLYLTYVAANFKACRTYGSTGGLEKLPAIAKSMGLYVAMGAWLTNPSTPAAIAANESQIESLIKLCKTGNVDIAIVGSEILRRGDLTDEQLLAYIARVKATGVKVTVADTWDALVSHPLIIAACDEVWANIYPFWEGASIDQAMIRFQSDYNQIKVASGGKKVVISETGWPSAGGASGSAIPSLENGAKYFADFVAWALGNKVDYYYFSAFDEPWKTEPGLVGPHWGIWDNSLKLKTGYTAGFKATAIVNPPIENKPFTYTPIAGVPQAVNDLGKMICQEQRNVVTAGGTESAPNFSTADQVAFDSSGKLKEIVDRVKASMTFTAGVSSIGALSTGTQSMVLQRYTAPLYLSWGLLGHVGSDGTTDAGFIVEGRIANELTNAVKTALGLPTSSIINQPFIYTPIDGVPDSVNDLGRMIDQEQRNVVTPGGNSWAPGFSSYDQSVFESTGKLTEIVDRVKASSTFTAGVAGLRTLTESDQTSVLAVYARPLYPTWAMNGHIGADGTTDAGYAVESQIATALTNAAKAAL